jgi:HlyD family secretion protein
MTPRRTRWLWWLVGVLVAGAVAWSFVPEPTSVEAARVSRGPVVVTVDEDGKTRVHDRFTVSAPVGGYLTRIALRPGASVRAGETVATIMPSAPTPLDVRSRTQLRARVDGAVDALRQARVRVDSARATLAQASREVTRQQQLERDRVVSPQELENARTRQQVAEADVNAAVAGVDVAEHDLEAARAALLAADADRPLGRPTPVRAPRDGAVLKVFEESARAVPAGAALIEIGDPAALEIVADLLSTDAVQVSPGARVILDRWGGEGALDGRVRLVEPSSFTKVSALGVEEQRVNVIVDFAGNRERVAHVGDGFAVEVRVVVWERQNALKVPVSALFRHGDQWSVYRVLSGRAVVQDVAIERQNDADAVVSRGLAEGDVVIVHPSERIADGTRVRVRE